MRKTFAIRCAVWGHAGSEMSSRGLQSVQHREEFIEQRIGSGA